MNVKLYSRLNGKGGRNQPKPRNDLSKHWLQGLFERATQRTGVTYDYKRPEYLDEERAAVTIEMLRDNWNEFKDLLIFLHIDLSTNEGRRRLFNGDESGISGAKHSSKTCKTFVIIPSNVIILFFCLFDDTIR